MKRKLLMIGNGMAGVSFVEQLLKLNPHKYEITIVGAEPHPNYNRILLSSVLAGSADLKDIVLNDWDWYRDNGIVLHAGRTAVSIDTAARDVTTDAGLRLPYDDLVLATGSRPFLLPLPGADKEGVIAFRDIKDCETMVETAKRYRKAVVIGGGLLGLEAARGLLNLGMEATVVHLHGYLMERQLDETAARMLQEELERQGMRFLLRKQSEAIVGRKRVVGLRFTDGTQTEADLIVMAVGIRPNVQLARASGIAVNRGIVVDDYLRTNVPGVYAVGECAEHRGITYGLVAPLYEQGAVLARVLADAAGAGAAGAGAAGGTSAPGAGAFGVGAVGAGVAGTGDGGTGGAGVGAAGTGDTGTCGGGAGAAGAGGAGTGDGGTGGAGAAGTGDTGTCSRSTGAGGGYQGSVTSTKLKVSGVEVFSAGRFEGGPGTKALRVQDDLGGIYKKVVFRDGKVVGAVLFGDASEGPRLFSLIRSGEDVTGREREVLFGPGGAAPGAGSDPAALAAAMSGDEVVCGCNGVTKDAILGAVAEKGCVSVAEIKACTKASGSCGGCKPLVEAVLASAVGTDNVQAAKEGICGCTPHTRDEVVHAIRRLRLTTSKEVMHVLAWTNPEGCSKCRPALNYYLGMAWPELHEDERESRFVNERNHANIQKDGTYSVVPRIYGGVTTPEELRRIASVAEKYEVPLVKITGGQRIDLLGVKKEDLPQVWRELDMPSGHAYGKALRTVKTCVGNTFCRFGTQDAIGMGIAMERRFEGLNTPHKVKLAVSGCPRNCAEATIKDLGVVAIDGGWELYAGGNGGTRVRAGELLVKVKTEAEVLEWTGAYLQYYRETANYLERTSEWVQRIGLETVKRALADRAERAALVARIDVMLAAAKDPWKQIVEDAGLSRAFAELAAQTDGGEAAV